MGVSREGPSSTVVNAWTSRALTGARRLGLSARGWALLGCSLVALACSTVVLVAVGQDVVSGDGLEVHDASNLSTVVAHRSPLLVSAAKVFTQVGSVKVLVPLAVVAAVLLWWRGAALMLALAPGVSLGITAALVAVAKVAEGRPRPPAVLRLVTETDASFPSGHASDSAGFFLVLAVVIGVVVFRRPAARAAGVAAAFALETLIGASRLELGVHWPTDVIVGWALGTTVAVAVATVVVLAARIDVGDPGERAGRARLAARRLWTLAHTGRGLARTAVPAQAAKVVAAQAVAP